jgi:hypothetical protein
MAELELLLYAGGKKRLQNQRGGDLIDDAVMLLAGMTCFVENLVGLVGGQALIPEVDGKAGQLTEGGGEGLSLDGLRADFAAQMDRVADDDSGDFETATETSERAQIVSRIAFAFQREHRLRGQAQCIRNRNPDAPVADVESEIAGFEGCFQCAAPALQLITLKAADAFSATHHHHRARPLYRFHFSRKSVRAADSRWRMSSNSPVFWL